MVMNYLNGWICPGFNLPGEGSEHLRVFTISALVYGAGSGHRKGRDPIPEGGVPTPTRYTCFISLLIRQGLACLVLDNPVRITPELFVQ